MIKKTICGWLLITAVALLGAGCGPSVSDVLKKYQAPYQKKREQFREIALSLPSGGSMSASGSTCPSLNPALALNEKTKQFNTEMVMFEQLSDPDASPKYDLRIHGDLLNSIQWTGPKNPLSPSVLDDNGQDMEKTLQAAMNYRYLVVNRVSDIIEPVAKDEKIFTGGRMTVESFVIDLNDNKTLCSFVTSAETLSDVEYSYKTNQSKKEQLQKFAYSSMWEEARKKLVAGLIEKTKGSVELD